MKIPVLITLLVLAVFINVPYIAKQGVATPPPLGNGVTLTVFPDRSVGVQAQMYNTTVPYITNLHIQHSVSITEDYGTGVLTDTFGGYPNPVGRNITFQFDAPSYLDSFNHTVMIWGPNGFTTRTLTVYPNATGSPLPYAQVQLNIAGTYYFNSTVSNTANIGPIPTHNPSSIQQITVIAAEENLPPTVKFGTNLNKQASEVLMTQNFNTTLTPFEKALFPFNDTQSLSISGSYANGQHSGTISFHPVPGISSPLDSLDLAYTSNDTYTVLSGSVNLTFNPALQGTPLYNRTYFQYFLTATLQNTTWINQTLSIPLNSTTAGRIQLSPTTGFTVTPTYNDNTSVLVDFKITLKGNLIRWFFTESGIVVKSISSKLSKIFNDTLALTTSSDYVVTYTQASGMIVAQSTSHLVVTLDSQFNVIKSEILNYANVSTTPEGMFINKTIITISSLNVQMAFSPASQWMEVTGIFLQPPTVNVTGGFEEYGLFNYTDRNMNAPVNFTLIGGFNSTHQVNIIIPAGVPAPTTSSPTMDTWWNIKNLTKLAPIVFSVAIRTATAPINLAAVAGNATVTVTWSVPVSVGGGIIHYNIYRGTTAGGEVMLSTATSTSFMDTGLTNGQTYYYKVSAVVTGGGEGPLTGEVSATPSAPLINISENPFTLTTNSTILNWSYNATSGVATFQVSGNLGVGSLKIAVPQSLVQSANNVTITFDGNLVTPTVTSDSNNYYFTLPSYHYTTHNVKMTLALASAITSATTPFPWLIIGVILAIIIVAGGGVYWYSKRRSNLKMPPSAATPTSPTSKPTKP